MKRSLRWPPDRRRILLSETALVRYAAKARPDLAPEDAAAELRWRARHGVLKQRRPSWVDGGGPGNVVGYLLLVTSAPEVALPLVLNVDGSIVALTAKVRPGPASSPQDAITGPRARGESRRRVDGREVERRA